MKRCATAAGALALLAVILMLGHEAAAKDPTIKDVMGKLHKGASAPLGLIKRDLQEDDPPWADIQSMTREFVVLGAALAKNQPPRGDKESWAKLAKLYLDDARAMDAAAQKKDKSGTLSAQGRLNKSCTACHKAHRPE